MAFVLLYAQFLVFCILLHLSIIFNSVFVTGFDDKDYEYHGISILKRSSENAGYHRDIKTEVWIPTRPNGILSTCKVLVMEKIPSGMYIDLYQTALLEDWGGPDVLAEENFDVEAPEHLSTAKEVMIFSDLFQEPNYLYASIEFPIHIRYHKPSEKEEFIMVNVSLSNPQVYINCSNNIPTNLLLNSIIAPCNSDKKDKCSWHKVKFIKESDSLLFNVPVGQISWKRFILCGTAFATLCGIYIIATALVVREVPVDIKQE